MKLEQLFQQLPEDYGNLPQPNIPAFDPRYSKVVGQFDGLDIWGSREFKGCDTYGILDDDHVPLAICRIELTANLPILRELWTNDSHRGKGYATILILFLLRKLNIKLHIPATEVVSDDARSFIIKGLKFHKFKAYDIAGNLLDISTAEDMLLILGTNEDELILAERSLGFDLFTDTWPDAPSNGRYFVVGMNQDLD